MLTGPVVSDIERTFRERWDGNSARDIPSPIRMLLDRAFSAGRMTGRDLPPPRDDPAPTGPHSVRVLRTSPARSRRYQFAPLGERGIAAAYRTAPDGPGGSSTSRTSISRRRSWPTCSPTRCVPSRTCT